MAGEENEKWKGKGKGGYHFRVTWPFWTLLVLNPIVGMELSSRERKPREAMGFDTLGYAWTINVLDSEFPALPESVSDGTATAMTQHTTYNGEERKRTRE
jgi:hypothetical protein